MISKELIILIIAIAAVILMLIVFSRIGDVVHL